MRHFLTILFSVIMVLSGTTVSLLSPDNSRSTGIIEAAPSKATWTSQELPMSDCQHCPVDCKAHCHSSTCHVWLPSVQALIDFTAPNGAPDFEELILSRATPSNLYRPPIS